LEIGLVSRKNQERDEDVKWKKCWNESVDVLILCLNINNPKDYIFSTIHWFGAALWNCLMTNTTHCFVLIIYGESKLRYFIFKMKCQFNRGMDIELWWKGLKENKRNIYWWLVNILVMLISQCNATFHSNYDARRRKCLKVWFEFWM